MPSKSCPKRNPCPPSPCSSSSSSVHTIEDDRGCSVSESDKEIKYRTNKHHKKIHNVHKLHEYYTHNHPVVVKTSKNKHITVNHKVKVITKKECSESETVCADSSSSASDPCKYERDARKASRNNGGSRHGR
jgi:hypothetical protein